VVRAVAGVAAARAAGARCLGITSSFWAERLAAAGADWTAPDLEGVPDQVLEWEVVSRISKMLDW
jgi:beta-phosphoglucomutase-like phosphatase (HAD superfamily)